MPIYEYACPACSCKFELRQGFHEVGPAGCPECGVDAQRVFSPVPIIFKGSGFYSTDHRGNHGHSSVESSKETKADSNETKADSSETKASSAEKSG